MWDSVHNLKISFPLDIAFYLFIRCCCCCLLFWCNCEASQNHKHTKIEMKLHLLIIRIIIIRFSFGVQSKLETHILIQIPDIFYSIYIFIQHSSARHSVLDRKMIVFSDSIARNTPYWIWVFCVITSKIWCKYEKQFFTNEPNKTKTPTMNQQRIPFITT